MGSVKFLTSQMMAILKDRDMRQNIWALGKIFVILVVFVAVYSVLFHMLMLLEGQDHSWLTGVYWTLTVMSTLGFGDITFHTDTGRAFSLIVLLTGVVLLLIVLPFSFIRHFYAPWMEAQLKLKAPREVPPETEGHTIICGMDPVAQALIVRFKAQGVSYVLIEPDPKEAVAHHLDGINVMVGSPERVETWRAARVQNAKLVVANRSDAQNTSITLTVREISKKIPVAAIVVHKDAIDVLELSGADHVIALKRRLGENLAAHANAGVLAAHPIGNFGDLTISELPVRRSGLAGQTLAETELRQRTGLTVVASWEKGNLVVARADVRLTDDSVIVLMGTDEQFEALNESFSHIEPLTEPALVIGGGVVGRAAVRALKAQGVRVNVIEQDETLKPLLGTIADRVVVGSGADINIMREAGIETTPSVVLSTHDDATNIFLTLYARRLNPNCHIVSRITHEHNLESVHRAGANFVLSESSLGAKLLLGYLLDQVVVVGEEVDVFVVQTPVALHGVTLEGAAITDQTGLGVIGTRKQGRTNCKLAKSTVFDSELELVLIGTRKQREVFRKAFHA